MKTAIVYYSAHHGNTKKLVEAVAQGRDVTLIDALAVKTADLSGYELIGFASGIYFGKFHQSVLEFAKNNLPEDKKVFFLSTYGGSSNTRAIEEAVKAKSAQIVGRFGCKGYDTFGPFKLVGGIAKGRPDEADLKNACDFFDGLQ
ncbi:MAG: flavodoxin [Lawsonibacter sp.]|jgi:flavodoxin|uniref:flavodoxin family protein n=1 Tax=Lawsonibacter sp. JLR.KK007 TaxID=3114293 RepID=UPI002170A2ED|nr:flavodoxin [Lawsonibacter sp.]